MCAQKSITSSSTNFGIESVQAKRLFYTSGHSYQHDFFCVLLHPHIGGEPEIASVNRGLIGEKIHRLCEKPQPI